MIDTLTDPTDLALQAQADDLTRLAEWLRGEIALGRPVDVSNLADKITGAADEIAGATWDGAERRESEGRELRATRDYADRLQEIIDDHADDEGKRLAKLALKKWAAAYSGGP